MQSRVGELGTPTTLLVFVFAGDQPDSSGEKLATFRVIVTPLASFFVQTKAGLESPVELPLMCKGRSHEVAIYSSEPRLVYLPKENLHKTFVLEKQSLNSIPVRARSYSLEPTRVKINAIGKFVILIVAEEKGRIYYQWLLVIATLPP